jgi:aarF domain-containing kinase
MNFYFSRNIISFHALNLLQTANTSAGIPAQMQLGLLSPLYLRRLFERMGATYIKLGQVRASSNFVL